MTLQLDLNQQLTIYVGSFIYYQVGSDIWHGHIACFILLRGHCRCRCRADMAIFPSRLRYWGWKQNKKDSFLQIHLRKWRSNESNNFLLLFVRNRKHKKPVCSERNYCCWFHWPDWLTRAVARSWVEKGGRTGWHSSQLWRDCDPTDS